MIRIVALFSLVVMGITFTLPAEAARLSESSEKSPVLAGALGGLVGFGTGHLYAKSDWTVNSTIFAAADAVGIGLLALLLSHSPSACSGFECGNAWRFQMAVLSLALAGERTMQGITAYQTAETPSESKPFSSSLQSPYVYAATPAVVLPVLKMHF